jgi:methylenetetrahydrofolate dehydrogenase (NADP+)/methenyltetrahydrofolate cyclohydrolase
MLETHVRKDNRLIDGLSVKKLIIVDISAYTNMHSDMPRLVSILLDDVPDATVYVRN